MEYDFKRAVMWFVDGRVIRKMSYVAPNGCIGNRYGRDCSCLNPAPTGIVATCTNNEW